MNRDEHIEKAARWAEAAPRIPTQDYSVADCYTRANYHLLLAIVKSNHAWLH